MSVRNANVNTRVGGCTRCRPHYVTLAAATTSANSRSTGTLELLYAQPPTLAIVGVDSVAADVHIAGYTRGRRRALTLAARAWAANTRWRLRWCREPCARYAAVRVAADKFRTFRGLPLALEAGWLTR